MQTVITISYRLVSIGCFKQQTSIPSCFIRQLSQFQRGYNIPVEKSNALQTFTTSALSRTILYSHRFIRHKSFNLAPKDRDSPVKRANWWTKWKRRADRRYQTTAERSNSTLLYLISLCVLTAGASYAAVPLYRIFCQTSGYGGTTQIGHDADKVETMETKKDRLLTIKFTADTAATMQWNFRPQQYSIDVYAGETALAFYTAKNPTKKPIDGISTYNVIPYEAGQYFNKIQCFCFEEQRLNPEEEVDMPVFFYIDPEFLEDPFLEEIDTIYLSYTFFESKPGLQLPVYHQPAKG